uniref:Myocyte enhancer factor 2D n=1 Tax=Anser brachyrhynchus TaxID=132585 RepID=A0A8B9BPN4_9AVES
MGRKKIQIQRITDERNRQVAIRCKYLPRGRKAFIICSFCFVFLLFDSPPRPPTSSPLPPRHPRVPPTPPRTSQALNKKHRECESPEGDEVFALTPQTEEKYKKIDEEFDKMMQSYRLASAVPAPNFAMPVTVPVTNQSTLQFSNPGSSLVTQSLVTSSLTDPRLLSPQQPALQRNTVSPGLPQRPASAGAMLGGDLNTTNGACPSPVGNGYVSARASPGLLPVSNGSTLGKIIPAKSPPPPPPAHGAQLAANSRKPDLRVITSQSGKGLMHHLTEDHLALQNTQRLGVSQATHSLTTPVVSVATPSLLTQGLPFSAMPTAYNTGKEGGAP